jgi:hypothetical protein
LAKIGLLFFYWRLNNQLLFFYIAQTLVSAYICTPVFYSSFKNILSKKLIFITKV